MVTSNKLRVSIPLKRFCNNRFNCLLYVCACCVLISLSFADFAIFPHSCQFFLAKNPTFRSLTLNSLMNLTNVIEIFVCVCLWFYIITVYGLNWDRFCLFILIFFSHAARDGYAPENQHGSWPRLAINPNYYSILSFVSCREKKTNAYIIHIIFIFSLLTWNHRLPCILRKF